MGDLPHWAVLLIGIVAFYLAVGVMVAMAIGHGFSQRMERSSRPPDRYYLMCIINWPYAIQCLVNAHEERRRNEAQRLRDIVEWGSVSAHNADDCRIVEIAFPQSDEGYDAAQRLMEYLSGGGLR